MLGAFTSLLFTVLVRMPSFLSHFCSFCTAVTHPTVECTTFPSFSVHANTPLTRLQDRDSSRMQLDIPHRQLFPCDADVLESMNKNSSKDPSTAVFMPAEIDIAESCGFTEETRLNNYEACSVQVSSSSSLSIDGRYGNMCPRPFCRTFVWSCVTHMPQGILKRKLPPQAKKHNPSLHVASA